MLLGQALSLWEVRGLGSPVDLTRAVSINPLFLDPGAPQREGSCRLSPPPPGGASAEGRRCPSFSRPPPGFKPAPPQFGLTA